MLDTAADYAHALQNTLTLTLSTSLCHPGNLALPITLIESPTCSPRTVLPSSVARPLPRVCSISSASAESAAMSSK